MTLRALRVFRFYFAKLKKHPAPLPRTSTITFLCHLNRFYNLSLNLTSSNQALSFALSHTGFFSPIVPSHAEKSHKQVSRIGTTGFSITMPLSPVTCIWRHIVEPIQRLWWYSTWAGCDDMALRRGGMCLLARPQPRGTATPCCEAIVETCHQGAAKADLPGPMEKP